MVVLKYIYRTGVYQYFAGWLFFVASILTYGNLNAQSKEDIKAVEAFYESLDCLRFIEEGDVLVKNDGQLQQIVLIRHGHPMISREGRFKRQDAMNYIVAYDTVNVYPFDKRPFCTDSGELKVVYTSQLQRSIHSAALVFGPEQRFEHRKDFNEFQRKIAKLPNYKKSMGMWSGISRALWILGFNDKGIESFGEAKMRAFKGAAFLEFDAERDGKSMLVAHGFLNRYIKKYLKKKGWKAVDLGGKEYFGVYVLFRFKEVH